MVKRALLVGCNYPGQQCELKGSVNDVERMRILLIKRFGFNPDEILELVDVDPRARQPTGANIRKCLFKLVDGVEPGDVLFFHFSGHGTQVPSERGRADETGYEECIVPSDMNLLSDDDFRDLVDRIPRGVNFTFIADACHSGGLIDSEKEQIGDRYSSGGRPRPPGLGRPAVGGGGLMDLASEGIETYTSVGGGRNNPIMNVVGQALGSRFNRTPGDEKNREFDPQEIDAYGRQPESPYERRYAEGGMPEYPTERPYERREPRGVETGSYDDGGSGYAAAYERRDTRGADRPYAGSAAYTQKYMQKAPTRLATGYALETKDYTATVKFMQSGLSVPETGYAERTFGYPTERPYDGPGSPYPGGYAPEATFGRPVGDDYGYPSRGAYDRPAIPGDDEFGYPPRGAYDRPLRPADDDYGYPARPIRPAEDDYTYPARPTRPIDGDYRYTSEGASRRRHGTEDSYVGTEDEPYDSRYGGERRQSYDPRDDDRRRPDREYYEKEHDRRARYGEGSSYEDSSRYPPKYPSEYPGSGGSYGVYPETGERYGDYSLSGDHGYSGKPHHTPLKNKSLPIEILMDILSQRTGQNVRLGNIHRTLYDLFGEDASPTVKFFVNILLNKMEDNEGEGGGHGHGLIGKIGGLASQFLKTKLDHGPGSPMGGGVYGGYSGDRPEEEFERYRRRHRRNYDAGVLISACEPSETSADANPTNNPRDAYGALSNSIQTVIGESRGPLTNRQVVMAARKLLSQQGYKQHPCLYCTDRNADALFLTPM